MKKIFIAPILLASAFVIASCSGKNNTTTTDATTSFTTETETTIDNTNYKVSKQEYINANIIANSNNIKADYKITYDGDSGVEILFEKKDKYAKITVIIGKDDTTDSTTTNLEETVYGVFENNSITFYYYDSDANYYTKSDGLPLLSSIISGSALYSYIYSNSSYDETKKAYVATDIDVDLYYSIKGAKASYELQFKNKKLISYKSVTTVVVNDTTSSTYVNATLEHGTSNLKLPEDLLKQIEIENIFN